MPSIEEIDALFAGRPTREVSTIEEIDALFGVSPPPGFVERAVGAVRAIPGVVRGAFAGRPRREISKVEEIDALFKVTSAVPVRGQDLEETFQEIAQATSFGAAAPARPSLPATFTPEGDLSIARMPPPPATALARIGLRPTLVEQAEQPAGFRPTPGIAEREARVAAQAEDLHRGAPIYGPEGRPTYVAPETLPIPEHARRAAIRAIYGPNIVGTTGTALRYFTQVLGMGETQAGQAIRETGKKVEALAEEVGRQYASGYEGRHVIDDPSLVLDPRWLVSGFVETGLSMAPGFVVGAGAVPTVRALGTTLELSPSVVLRLSRLGGALGFSATGGFQEGAGTYREVLSRGGTEADAAKSATVFGLASMALNAISAERFFRALPAGARAKLVRFLTTGALEAATEAAEEPTEAFVLGDDAWKALKEAGLDVAVPTFLTGLVAPAVGGRLAPRRGLNAPAMGAERIIAATERHLVTEPITPPGPPGAPPGPPSPAAEPPVIPDEAAALRDFLARRARERPSEPPGAPSAPPAAPTETLAESAARRRGEATEALIPLTPAPEGPAAAPQRPAGEEFWAAVAPQQPTGAPAPPLPAPSRLAQAVGAVGPIEGLDPTDPAQLVRFVRAQGGLAPSPTGDLMGQYRAIPLYVKNRRGLSPDLMAQAVSEAAGRPVSDAELLDLLAHKGRRAAEAQARGRAEVAAPERAAEVEQQARDLAALPEEEKIRRIMAMTGMSEVEARQRLTRPVIEPTEPVEAEPVRLETDPVVLLDRGLVAPPDSAEHRQALDLMDALAEWIDIAGDLTVARQRPERDIITPGRRGLAALALTPEQQRAIVDYAFPAGAEALAEPAGGPGARRPDVAPPAPPGTRAAALGAEAASGAPAREPERAAAPAVALAPEPVAPRVAGERPAFRPAPRPAPATFAFYQEIRGREPLAQYHLTEDIPGHPKDSTVSPETLREAGYDVPETPNFEAWQRTRGVEEPQAAYAAPPFFSALRHAIEQRMPARAPAGQVGAIARSPGVKPDEVRWIGLDDWLAAKQGAQVTKAEVLDFLRQNEVRVEEVVKGSALSDAEQRELDLLERRRRDYEAEPTGRGVSPLSAEEGRRYDDLYDKKVGGTAKFVRYTLPGAAPGTYRELLLTLPRLRGPREIGKWEVFDPGDGRIERVFNTEAEARAFVEDGRGDLDYAQITAEPIVGRDYRSPHWDEPNVLAHVRFNERTDAQGKRVLFIEELQSDFGQQTRRERAKIAAAIRSDFDGIVEQMKRAGDLKVECD